jgi:hypothetical protein
LLFPANTLLNYMQRNQPRHEVTPTEEEGEKKQRKSQMLLLPVPRSKNGVCVLEPRHASCRARMKRVYTSQSARSKMNHSSGRCFFSLTQLSGLSALTSLFSSVLQSHLQLPDGKRAGRENLPYVRHDAPNRALLQKAERGEKYEGTIAQGAARNGVFTG